MVWFPSSATLRSFTVSEAAPSRPLTSSPPEHSPHWATAAPPARMLPGSSASVERLIVSASMSGAYSDGLSKRIVFEPASSGTSTLHLFTNSQPPESDRTSVGSSSPLTVIRTFLGSPEV